MESYITEGIRYYRVAKQNCESVEQNSHDAFVSLIFSAMYFESVINEVIFKDKLSARLFREHFTKSSEEIDLDIYARESLTNKLHLIFGRYSISDYEQDPEYVEICHLFLIRGQLVHLKPTEQQPDGTPDRKLCKKALNYLHKNMRIIEDPFGPGVYWTDVLMNQKVADWGLSVVREAIYWLYKKTHDGCLGNTTLSWHCQLTGSEKWQNQKHQPTVKTPVESGNVQGTAAEL